MPLMLEFSCLLAIIEPGYLVAALFLAGMGIVIGLQVRHYRRMEALTQRFQRVSSMEDEMISLREALKAVDPARMFRLAEEIRNICLCIEEKVNLPPSLPLEPVAIPDEQYDLSREIERRFKVQGYSNIRILAERLVFPEDPEEETRLPIEAYRDGVAHKGYALIKNRRVVSERLKPAYEAFP